MTLLRPVLVAGVCAALACGLRAAPLNEFIAVSSTAAPDYVRPTDAQGRLRPEFYVFSRGVFLEGAMKDPGLSRTDFMDLARTLAPSLAKQNYFPTRDVAAATILILVHWGSTLVDDNPLRDRMIESLGTALPAYAAAVADVGHADTGPLNQISDFFQWTRENSNNSFARNAALLGYARELGRSHADFGLASEQERTMQVELSEERYFLVLTAYDYTALKRDKKSKLLWVTRLSVRAPGNNFAEALPVLSQAGAQVFGRQLAGLTRLDANLREGIVSVKSLRSLGVVEDAGAKSGRP